MRVGVETAGRWGLTLLAVTGGVGLGLAIHGWSGRASGVPSAPLAAGPRTTAATPSPSTPGVSASASGRAPSPSATPGPLLSTEPYANVAFQVWPGTVSAAARQALTGLTVSVHQKGSALSVTAGVNGQQPSAAQLYPDGARVYVVESALGDDSGNADYNLGDDALVVTNAQGRIIR
jgi:hypothetical protein